MRLLRDVVEAIPKPVIETLPAPPYLGVSRGLMLAVESMSRHMTDEGWQIAKGLEHAGYRLAGKDCTIDSVDVPAILEQEQPNIVVMQDKREWEGLTADCSRDPSMRFRDVECLAKMDQVFKVTILKDAHARPEYHRQSAEEIGCHAWIVYYHPAIVSHLAPYVRPKDLIRTWHTIDKNTIPMFYVHPQREGAILSGAISDAYPLRKKIMQNKHKLPNLYHLPHPGYHRNGCVTSTYYSILSNYKVAICTSSIYGYALRKIIEAVACGCVVITDLPLIDRLPLIDDYLVRVNSDISIEELGCLLQECYKHYDYDRQCRVALRARDWYDYRPMGIMLAEQIEEHRNNYECR